MTMGDEILIPEEHIPIKAKINLSVGGFANNMLNGFVFANITFYYTEKLGADPSLTAIAWLIFAIWNTLNDPIISYIIDNTRTKIGRRIPYIRYGSLFYGLAFIFCWFPIASIGDDWGLFFNFLFALFLLDTMFTIVGCCFYCLPNEVAITAKERANINLYMTVALAGQVVLGITLPILLLTGQIGVHPLFLPLMVFIGLGCSLLLFISSYGIKENMFAQMQPHEGFLEGLILTFKNKAFWIFAVTAFCVNLLFPILQTGILYYIDYIVGDQNMIPFLITLLIGLIIGGVFTFKKIESWGPKKVMMINLIFLALGFSLLFFVGRNVLASTVPYGLIGLGIVGAVIGIAVIAGDCIDNDEIITGKRREAIYGGVNAIVTKPSISIANWIFLGVIELFGFIKPVVIDNVPIPQPQSDWTLMGLLLAFGLIPAILFFISTISLHWYPLAGPEWRKKKKYIIELHEKKEKEYLQKLVAEGKIKSKDNM
jgi:GPH family glycoside/pentoside/hexuronide:cation symporter